MDRSYRSTHEEHIHQVSGYRRIEELLPREWMQGSVRANGIRQYYYRTGGDKPPLVLLHGFMEGALSWLRPGGVLEQDYDVIMVDTRGHGRSDRIGKGYNQSLLVEDVAGFLSTLALENVYLLGFSQGGMTGIHVAERYPHLVRKLIVAGWGEVSDTDFMESEGYRTWLNSFTDWLESLGTQTHEGRLMSSLGQLPPGAPLPPEDEYVPWVFNSANLDIELVRLGPSLWSDVKERTEAAKVALQAVRCPVLIMKSSFFPEPGKRMTVREEASGQDNVRVVWFENSGHLIHREQFDAFIELVRGFFGN